MVLGPKSECDGIALSGLDVVGLENKRAALVADGDDMILCDDCASERSDSENGGKMHNDWLNRD